MKNYIFFIYSLYLKVGVLPKLTLFFFNCVVQTEPKNNDVIIFYCVVHTHNELPIQKKTSNKK